MFQQKSFLPYRWGGTRRAPCHPACYLLPYSHRLASIGLCQGPPGHPQVWWLTKRTQDSESWLWFITARKCKAESAKEKGTWSQVQRKRCSSFQKPSPCELTFFGCEKYSSRVDCGPSGTLTRDPVPRSLTGGWLCKHPSTWHAPKFPAPSRKASTRHEPLFVLFRESEPFLSGNGGNTPDTQVPRCQPRASLASRPF